MHIASRTVYHTHLKYLAHENLLSLNILQRIPKSTMARWKKEDPLRYQSFDLNLRASSDYEAIRHFAGNPSAKRIYAAYVRVIKTVLAIAHSLPGFHRAIKAQSKNVVELVGRVKKLVGFKCALRFFNISVQTFRNWAVQLQAPCSESLTGACNRVFHNQLSRPEVLKIKELLTDQQFQYWPVSSLAFHALRENILPLGLNTWYKYVNKLGLARARPHSRRKKNAVSVRAQGPHQIWHADITVFVTADQVKHYIYAVVDNFSRKIVSWFIAGEVKAEYRRATIEEALKSVGQAHPGMMLITDGGPENNLKTFLASLEQPIVHKVALVDVHYSNSLIEASFKTAKYNYLYRMDIRDGNDLKKSFAFLVQDFNERPHVSLNGLTPNEAEKNTSVDKEQWRAYIKNATEGRIKYNKTNLCGGCRA
jgi:putative transposase